ncbi:hypothetical protein ABZ912_29970 [Nonomuraea angiospora]|uniref:hypothetical protein n=1 Tax=Nonomuraea angiospora TaxID=46172 RepID=UPI0033CF80CC
MINFSCTSGQRDMHVDTVATPRHNANATKPEGDTLVPSIAPGVTVIIRRRKRTDTLQRELSIRAAVRRFNEVAPYTISDMKWGRIESGKVETVSDIDLAWMAYVVGGSSDELTEDGAAEAAKLLRGIIAKRNDDPALAGMDLSLTPETVQHGFQKRLQEIRSLPRDDERDRMERLFLQQIDMVLRAYEQQIEIIRNR